MAKLGQTYFAKAYFGCAKLCLNMCICALKAFLKTLFQISPYTVHGMAKLGQGIVRHGMSEGVAKLITLPTGWQNWGRL